MLNAAGRLQKANSAGSQKWTVPAFCVGRVSALDAFDRRCPMTSSIEAELFHPAAKSIRLQVEHLGGTSRALDDPVCVRERREDMCSLHVFEGAGCARDHPIDCCARGGLFARGTRGRCRLLPFVFALGFEAVDLFAE